MQIYIAKADGMDSVAATTIEGLVKELEFLMNQHLAIETYHRDRSGQIYGGSVTFMDDSLTVEWGINRWELVE